MMVACSFSLCQSTTSVRIVHVTYLVCKRRALLACMYVYVCARTYACVLCRCVTACFLYACVCTHVSTLCVDMSAFQNAFMYVYYLIYQDRQTSRQKSIRTYVDQDRHPSRQTSIKTDIHQYRHQSRQTSIKTDMITVCGESP